MINLFFSVYTLTDEATDTPVKGFFYREELLPLRGRQN